MKLFQRTEQFLVATLNSLVAIARHRVEAVQVQNGNSTPADLNSPAFWSDFSTRFMVVRWTPSIWLKNS